MLCLPIAIHKDPDSDFGVTVPDLPGCFSAGKTLEEAVVMAREAIELHLEGLIEAGEPIPQPGSLDQYSGNREYAGATWAVVSLNPSALGQRATRISITMPSRFLARVDRHAKRIGESRSGLLIRAVAQFIGEKAIRSRRGRPRAVRFRKGA